MKVHIKNKLNQIFRLVFRNKNTLESKTVVLKKDRKSDVERWSQNNSLHENWNERTELLASYLSDTANIIEFGAGSMFMKTILKSNQLYMPSDLIKRYPNTLVCDLNKPLEFDLSLYDTVVFSGVLEYVYDIENVFEQIQKAAIKQVVLSYCCSDILKVSREKNGWLSDYTKSEMEAIFKKNNYRIADYQVWNKQSIFNLRIFKE